MWYKNVLETIGNTPMVQINKLTKDLPCTVLAKIETGNPGNSIKDRMAVKMIDDAEKAGKLKPGYTIIEGTSGNTGMGLAIAAVIRGYRCIFTTTDKQSREKVDALKAFGAEVIVCPTDVDPEDPRSYYSVSSRLEKEIPNSWKPNQYDNLSNSAARYLGKMFNDDWMRDRGFLVNDQPKAIELIERHKHLKLVTANANEVIHDVVVKMRKYDISQIPVVNDAGEFVGSLNDSHLFSQLIEHPDLKTEKVEKVVQPPFPFVHHEATMEEVSKLITRENNAVMVKTLGGDVHIITKQDVIDALA
jgi:CBS domain-containing protein